MNSANHYAPKMRWRRYVKLSATFIFVVLLIRGCNEKGNALKSLGFQVDDSSIAINEEPQNLKGAQLYVKANLTMAQAKALRKTFVALPPSGVNFYATTKDMPLLEGNDEWQPQSVKKYWVGNFGKVDYLNSLYNCKYLFDISQQNRVVLYVYGITFDD